MAAQAGQRARVNKLVSVYSSSQEEGERETSRELTTAVRQLCRQADAFVLVVDPSNMTEEGTCTCTLWPVHVVSIYSIICSNTR